MADGLLLTRGDRLRMFTARFALGLAPTLALAAAAVAVGAAAVGVAVTVFGGLCALLVGSNARTLRGAAVAGVAIAVVLFLAQLVLAWLITHPVIQP